MTTQSSSDDDHNHDGSSSVLSEIEISIRTGDGDGPHPNSSNMLGTKDETRNLGRYETKQVRALRVVTLLVLLAAAFLCSYGIYMVTQQSQEDAFELEYYAQADKVIESFHTSVEEFLGSFDALSSSITSYATDSGSVFPNVTVSDFEIRGTSARILAQGIFVQYMPLVTDDNRREYEAYSATQQGHLFPAFMKEQQLKTIQDIKFGYVDPADLAGGAAAGGGAAPPPAEENAANGGGRNLQLETIGDQTFREQIWGTSGIGEDEAEGTGPYLPIWQMSPVLPLINLLNMNTLDLFTFNGPYNQVLNTGQASLGIMTHLDDPTDENGEAIKVLNAMLSLGQYRHELEEYTSDPITSIGYPVFDSFAPNRKVVGVLGSALYWRLLFKNVLPAASKTILNVVVRNSFGQEETYRINGADVSFVGDGDLHDADYDHMVQTENIANYVTSLSGPESRSYTAVDLNSNYVVYDIDVYPTMDMKENFVDDQPLHYALGILAIFAFTVIVFLLYNNLVERRQKVVVDKAARSSAVVNSLFPANVQKRLYAEAENGAANKQTVGSGSAGKDHGGGRPSSLKKKRNDNQEWTNGAGVQGTLTRFLSSSELGVPQEQMKRTSDPIADLFPEATVFFADLVGFTKWSSVRTPIEVFGLLETIYGAFDRIATRRRVFKVETIGDCYVAVTGLPEAQPDHAVIMAKFATECMLKLRHVLSKMVSKFGDDTVNLSMRVGIHSGPVTAGVLRGERARFQLFGDTVNTAARMESNGEPCRIQCSQATADCLLLANRAHWLKQRDDTINAKGKGKMKTYWVELGGTKTNRTSGSVVDDLTHHSNPSVESERSVEPTL